MSWNIWRNFFVILLLFIVPQPAVYSRDRLLSLRSRAAVLNRRQCLLITHLGLRRRGCRGGQHRRRRLQPANVLTSSAEVTAAYVNRNQLIEDAAIPVVCGRRQYGRECGHRQRQSVLTNCLTNLSAVSEHKVPESLSFMVLNAHSLVKNNAFQSLTAEVVSVQPDLICICETWFKAKHSESLFAMDGYTCHRLDRKGKGGGGVCVYVKGRLQTRRLVLQMLLDSAEIIWVRVRYNEAQYFCVCVCYHPPKPRYSPPELVSVLQDNLTELLSAYPDDAFVIAGDLNQLRYQCLLVDYGLTQIVTVPTRKTNVLDVFLTSRPDLFHCRVAKSVLKSDHLAVYINCDKSQPEPAVARRQTKCYNTSPADIAKLTKFFHDYNWNALVNGIDCGTLSVDQAFADFVTVLQYALEHIVGYRTVTVRERDPPYITPPIRILLRKRNKLLRRGKSDSAQPITIRFVK